MEVNDVLFEEFQIFMKNKESKTKEVSDKTKEEKTETKVDKQKIKDEQLQKALNKLKELEFEIKKLDEFISYNFEKNQFPDYYMFVCNNQLEAMKQYYISLKERVEIVQAGLCD